MHNKGSREELLKKSGRSVGMGQGTWLTRTAKLRGNIVAQENSTGGKEESGQMRY